MKGKLHFTRRKDCKDSWTMNQAANNPRTNVCLFHSLEKRKYNSEYYDDKSLIAQPVFVFKKKDQPCKRPAEDYECKTENVFIDCSRKRARASSFSFQTSSSPSYREAVPSPKRMRSSSFTILPTFPPSQPVKNNVFMTSALLYKGPKMISTENILSSPSVQRVVLRPAVLQPPQSTLCKVAVNISVENVLEDEGKANPEVSKETCSLRSCSEKAFLSQDFSGPETTDTQLGESETSSSEKHLNFVFGENIVERVLRPEQFPELPSTSESCKTTEEAGPTIGSPTSSPTTPVFTKNKTLVESAAAYTSKKPTQQYLLDKVEVSTGEEAERNVLQINCRLFLFNKASMSWTERGSGSLRLNDMSSNQCGMLQSRLVMRNQGSMRLILNAKLWTQMIIQRANRKSLCITATDLEDHSVKVFLIQASSKDIGSLYAAIHHRLIALRSFAEQDYDTSQVEMEPLNCDSDEEETERTTHVYDNESDHSRWIRRQPVVCS